METRNRTKGTQFTRVLQYFRTADVAEAQACLNACVQEVAARRQAANIAANTPAVPKQKRHRRTKAELLAAKAAGTNGADGASETLANA